MTERKGTRSYQRNFQTKMKRRRQCKTNYLRRSKLIRQDVNKHGAVKSRLVVRKTNSKIICTIFKAFLDGDRVVAHADSSELKNYGINFGLTNYFAAYATGLLVGRRALMSMNLDSFYQPNREIGTDCDPVDVKSDVERRPYKVFLDIGLSRSVKGSKIYGAMKGASDAGLFIPHSPSIFPGYNNEDSSVDPSILRDRIFNKPMVDWMQQLKEEDPSKYQKQFSEYIKLNISPDSIEKRYQDSLDKILENPEKISSREKVKTDENNFSRKSRSSKISHEERKKRIESKLAAGNSTSSKIE